jgi:HAE1 family hydrophobic/amphiphilic exporter-1
MFWVRGYNVPASTVVIAVSRQAGANAVEVAKSIRDSLDIIRNEVPPTVRVTPIYDRSASIVNSLFDVETTLSIAFVLVVMVIFVFLGRASDTLIPAAALPLSMLLTLLAMQVLGYSIDNLSLMALTLAIGFLVDDAIVFLENTVRRMEHGESAVVAAVHGAKEISFTILAMTISLAAVFLPLAFMSGIVGRIFREFAVTIIVSIFASGIVSLTLTPLMCSRLLRDRGPGSKKNWFERLVNAIEKSVVGIYGSSLWFFLRHRWISALIWVGCLSLTVVLFQIECEL